MQRRYDPKVPSTAQFLLKSNEAKKEKEKPDLTSLEQVTTNSENGLHWKGTDGSVVNVGSSLISLFKSKREKCEPANEPGSTATANDASVPVTCLNLIKGLHQHLDTTALHQLRLDSRIAKPDFDAQNASITPSVFIGCCSFLPVIPPECSLVEPFRPSQSLSSSRVVTKVFHTAVHSTLHPFPMTRI